MITEVFPGFYKLEVPLPMGSLLLSINSYLVKGEGRSLLVDTTLNYPSCKDMFMAHLKELKVDITSTDIFITHFHVDHSGLLPDLATATSKVFSSYKEAFSENKGHWKQMMRDTLMHGYPDYELSKFKERITVPLWEMDSSIEYSILNEGDELDVGDYIFKCLETPGHSSGHMCLYEPEKRILFSGDHILPTISPIISAWADDSDALGAYFNSLNKIAALNMEIVLPGHGNVFSGCNERIAQITSQLENRLAETLDLLRLRERTAYEIASQLSWNISDSWESLDSFNKLLALGEALANLKHLERNKLVRSREIKGKIVYCPY